MPTTLATLLSDLSTIGRNERTGGYNRIAWTGEDTEARDWFTRQAQLRNLAPELDRNGNLWCWWPEKSARAIVVGSHLDSVPEGGAFDGALGLAIGFCTLDVLREANVTPSRPIALVAFADEEGSGFGVPTLGSRLMTGDVEPQQVIKRSHIRGGKFPDVVAAFDVDPDAVGRDSDRLSLLDAFLEVHIEQGRALADVPSPVGIATGIWPHGRWRLSALGESNHAGTTALKDRRDPMLVLASAIVASRDTARSHQAVATIGKVLVNPNSANSVPQSVDAWLDARARSTNDLFAMVDDWKSRVNIEAERAGVEFEVSEESFTPAVTFDSDLQKQLAQAMVPLGVPTPAFLDTAAGHDAGVLAAHLPTAMLFVRNESGKSHCPGEHAELDDCLVAIQVLADVLKPMVTA